MSANFTIEWFKQKIENIEASYKHWLGLGNYPDKDHEMEIANMKNVLAELEESRVKHGEWIFNEKLSCVVCSVCNCKAPINFDFRSEYLYSNFCPNCGADMRGINGNE